MKPMAENTMKLKKTEYSLLNRLFLLIAMFGAISIGLTNNSQAQSPTFTNNGPSAAIATKSGSQGGGAMTIAPSNPNVIYLSTDSRGAFKSTDGGTTWMEINNGIPVDPNNGVIPPNASMVVDPTNANIAYRGFQTGTNPLYKTTDGGANWSLSRLGLPDSCVYAMVIHPSAPNTIYAGLACGASNGVWRSTDSGATWNLRSNGLLTPSNTFPVITNLAIAPSDPNVIYAATRSGFYKTIDGGANWTKKLTSQFSDISSAQIVVHPTDPNIFYMTFFQSGGFMGLGKSINGADSNLTVIDIPNSGSSRWGLALDPTNPAIIYTGVSGTTLSNFTQLTGIFKSTNSGMTWTNSRNGLPNQQFTPYLVNVNPSNPAVVYAGTNYGTFKSEDGGVNWQGLQGINDTNIQATASAPGDSNIAYTATNAGYFKTTNRGVNWSRTNPPPSGNGVPGTLQGTLSLAVSPNNPGIVFTGLSGNGLWKSPDSGTTWTRPAGIQSDFLVPGIWTDPNNPEVVYCTAGIVASQLFLYKSTDTGNSFQTLSPPISVGSYMNLSVSKATPNTVYLTVKSQSSSTNYFLYKSTNGGLSWTEVTQAATLGETILSPTDPNLIYLVSTRSYICGSFSATAPQLLRSTNGGASFTPMASAGFAQNSTAAPLGIDPIDGALYIASTYNASECSPPSERIPGILRSTNGGASWSLFAQTGVGGIPTSTIIKGTASLFAPNSRTFYLGTSGAGIFVGSLNPVVQRRPPFDFDGDAKTDISIFRPAVGEWWINRSSSGQTVAAQFGSSSDKIVPSDFTGDGKTDIAFFRPASGFWFILRSEDGSFFSFPFGTTGDMPSPADYDGDGKADVAVFRPSTSTWYILNSSGSGTSIIQFGATGDVPVTADYDGDGKSDIGIFRPSVVQWWYIKSSDSQTKATTFGVSTDKPVQGDYTGDGKADIAFFRPATGEWFIVRSEDNSFFSFPFGASGDVPVPGDYDGDGKFDATVFRSSNLTWYSNRTTAGILIATFGATGDQPVPNAFVP